MSFIIFILNICLYKRLWDSCYPGSRGSQTLWDPSGPLFSWQKHPVFLYWGRGKVRRRREEIVFGGRGSTGWKTFIQRSQSRCSSLIFALNPRLFSSCFHRDCCCLPHSSCCSPGLSGARGWSSASGFLRGPVSSPLCLLLTATLPALSRGLLPSHAPFTQPQAGHRQEGPWNMSVTGREGDGERGKRQRGAWGERIIASDLLWILLGDSQLGWEVSDS